MPGGKNNTLRIEALEGQAANISARLDVHESLIQILQNVLEKNTDSSTIHSSQLAVIERTLVIADFKELQKVIVEMQKEQLA